MQTNETAALKAPAIGSEWVGQGGIYAGLQRGRDGAPDYHLIVGPEIKPCKWGAAKEKAAAVEVDGHKDFSLPFRAEQALQFANVPELFESAYYWSCEAYAPISYYAWSQYFTSGGQGDDGVDSKLRCRAVRRLIIK